MLKLSASRSALVAGVATLAAAVAHAEVPAGAQAIFTTAATDFGTLMGYGYTAAGVIIGGFIIFKLVKRVANKTTS